jgi:hypothetical protein
MILRYRSLPTDSSRLVTGREKPDWSEKTLLVSLIHQKPYVDEFGMELWSPRKEVRA